MKRTMLALISLVLLVSVGFTQSRDANYPLANGRKLIVTNLLKPELWGFFDNAGLAAALSKISEEYELTTDFNVAFNPTASYLYLPVQSIEFDLAKASKISPVTRTGIFGEGEIYSLPTDLQKQIMVAVIAWVRSFIGNPAAPEDLRGMLNRLTLSAPPRFICSISNAHRYIVLSGIMPALQYVSFDPKIVWREIGKTGELFQATITIPAPYNDFTFTSVQNRMYLENPDIPGNPSLKKDTIWIYKLFGLR